MNLWQEQLRPFERQILYLLTCGYRNQQIADQLGYTYHGTKSSIARIYEALGVQKRTEAAVMALRFEIVDRAAVWAVVDSRSNGHD